MFSRRTPPTSSQRLRDMVWPAMGWKRWMRYIGLRIMRIGDSTHNLALGLTLGFVISFVPVPGTHIIQAAILTWMLRGNVLASVIGTIPGNPLTFPPMWWLSFKTGEVAYGLIGHDVASMPDHRHLTFAMLKADVYNLLIPWTIGGYILAGLLIVPSYAFFYWLVARLRRRQKKWQGEHVREHTAEILEQKL